MEEIKHKLNKEQDIAKLPLISIVVPVYNATAFLEKTVDLILAQTYPNIEIILVNDGSKDASLALCKEIATKDARVRVVDKENGGVSSARNAGMKVARGKYIGFVDSDDHILPDMYENLYRGAVRMEQEYAKGTDAYFVQIGREEVEEDGTKLPDAAVSPKEDTFVTAKEYVRSLLLYTGDTSFCTMMIPLDYMKRHPFTEGITSEDFRRIMELVNSDDSIVGLMRLHAKGYQVVHRAGSMTRRANPTQFSQAYIDIIKHADYVENHLITRYPDLKDDALRFGLYQRMDYLLHIPIAQMNQENTFYRDVVHYLRAHFASMLRLSTLTTKNKIYMTLFSVAPKTVRKVHWKIRGKKILEETS